MTDREIVEGLGGTVHKTVGRDKWAGKAYPVCACDGWNCEKPNPDLTTMDGMGVLMELLNWDKGIYEIIFFNFGDGNYACNLIVKEPRLNKNHIVIKGQGAQTRQLALRGAAEKLLKEGKDEKTK